MLIFSLLGILVSTIVILLNSKVLKIDQNTVKKITLKATILCFFLSIFLWIFFDKSCVEYQFI